MIQFLEEQHVARTYMPERLEVVAEMPKTPSGKIQKFRLRETAKGFGVPGLDGRSGSLSGVADSRPDRGRCASRAPLPIGR